jgi:hypothetical protein
MKVQFTLLQVGGQAVHGSIKKVKGERKRVK